MAGWNVIKLSVGNIVLGSWRFDKFGSKQHERALNRAQERFVLYVGYDLKDEFYKYLELIKNR